MVEQVICDGSLLAIIIRADYKKEGIEFFTPGNFSQQLGYMNRPKGYTIDPHVHKPLKRQITLTQEVLIVKSGSVRIDFYDVHKSFFKSDIIYQGDVILLASGGHGFEMLEDAELIEVKQGPYNSDEDKIRFNPRNKKI